jgi:hypothetical protein
MDMGSELIADKAGLRVIEPGDTTALERHIYLSSSPVIYLLGETSDHAEELALNFDVVMGTKTRHISLTSAVLNNAHENELIMDIDSETEIIIISDIDNIDPVIIREVALQVVNIGRRALILPKDTVGYVHSIGLKHTMVIASTKH